MVIFQWVPLKGKNPNRAFHFTKTVKKKIDCHLVENELNLCVVQGLITDRVASKCFQVTFYHEYGHLVNPRANSMPTCRVILDFCTACHHAHQPLHALLTNTSEHSFLKDI